MTSFLAIDRLLTSGITLLRKCLSVLFSDTETFQTQGIALHPISFYGKDDPQKRKRRKKWVDFGQLKRAHWTPSKHSHVCSKHFREEDFTVRFSGLMEENVRRRLRKD